MAGGKLLGQVVGARGIGSSLGGDELWAALPGRGAATGATVGEEIRAAIGSHAFEREGIRLRPGISIGVAAYPDDAAQPGALFQKADEALYRAKLGGKNRVCR